MINVTHNLDEKYACRNDAGYCGRDKDGNEIYVFKIYGIKINESTYDYGTKFNISIRGMYTYWMNIDSCFVLDGESELLEYVEIQKQRELLKTKTYTVSTKDGCLLT